MKLKKVCTDCRNRGLQDLRHQGFAEALFQKNTSSCSRLFFTLIKASMEVAKEPSQQMSERSRRRTLDSLDFETLGPATPTILTTGGSQVDRAVDVTERQVVNAPARSLSDASASKDRETFHLRPSLGAGDVSDGTAIWCEDLSYSIKKKQILFNINFCAKPGELTVIMGPSGSGKTSLINAILQRLRRGKVTGTCGLNNTPMSATLVKDHCHYVMSYDLALGYLTVRETLETTARLRMPQAPYEEQQAAIEWVLNALELKDCENVLVGGDWRKGISKGQLKRLAIAQELLGDPDLVFLDEPTTGLDSNLAYELIFILKKIAKEKNKTIIASIHQPNQKAFELFDSVVLISNGHLIYHGPGADSVQFMRNTGRVIPRSFSPPDFLLEIATDEQYIGSRSLHSLSQKELSGVTDLGSDDDLSEKAWRIERPNYSTAAQLEELERTYRKSAHFANLRDDIAAAKSRPVKPKVYNLAAKWSEEFKVLWKRSTLNSLRNPLTSTIIVIVNILQALILGALFFQLQAEKSDVTTPPMSDWELWQNPVLQYLAYGLDREGYDPFLDVIEQGVDQNGRQILMDMMVNPEIVNYLLGAVQCARELSAADQLPYPPHRWAEGSITGTSPSTTITTVSSSGDVTPQLPSVSFEEIVSVLVEATQLADYAVKLYDTEDPTNWVDPAADTYAKWLAVANRASPLVQPVTCCLGMYRTFSATASTACASAYPNYTFNKMPNLPDFSIQASVSGARRLVEDFYKFLVEHHPEQGRRPAEEVRRELLNTPRRAIKRRLGSSLGGLATDLWALIANNPNSPLYAILSSFRSMGDRISECSTSTCEYFQSMISSAGVVMEDIVATVLTVLNMGGAIFFCVANLGFASYDCLLAFPKDRAMFNRENANGMYKPSSFFLGRTLADIPFQLVPCILWSIVYYWMVGYEATAHQFFQYLLMCFFVSFCAYSFGYMISSFSPRLEVAVVLSPLILVVMLVLAGFFLRDAQIPAWIAWFRYLSIYRWGFFGLGAIQFPPGKGYGALDNNLILMLLGITENRWGISLLCLIGLSFGYRILSYVGLVFTNRSQGMEV
eukprot:Blabericola_migrator_1__1520@NODE_13_length_24280_cov_225_960393_g10_i0_p3_GENE_NODE_13_length_24280_cov_225_960393_g10_i0NODE_13_length_24280_cov_225_960393_g10_i0_p3_ORF_typecomplete_len1072_score160_40ABC2_membrane/PF01061_24/0_00077ABC2_membrane/PF01061_24/7_6e35ABC_tran/PF00005_27/3_4e24ABC2_membrane_3/PF12698_7/3_8e02ABC2_membrane_3/PF12698_7/4_5e09AAA_21/PF13304_6/9_5e07AAA_15/PF13175_6/0_0031AAA_15/PF13175_6/0_56AAA_16/PF13191_6/9e05AAA_25/PF13481_6/7_6e05AAA_22/PF13401_6/0_00011AAA_29/P